MRAVVLVGGLGTRLRPLTLRTPKQLLPIAEITMLERLLRGLADNGVEDVVLSMGYRPDAFRSAFPDGRCAGVRLDYAVEDTPLDTGGGIAFAARHAGIDERFLVLNGDVLHEFDLGALVAFHEAGGADASLALTPVDDPKDFGLVVTDDAGRVSAFVEKGQTRDAAMGNRINAGVYVFEPAVLDRLPPDQPLNIETEVFPKMAADGVLFAREMPGWWIDVGTRERYLRANADVLAAEGRSVLVAADAAVDGAAQVTDSVIGAGACVGAGARVVGSVVHAGARIGDGATVEQSIVGAGAFVAPGAALRAEIVAADVAP